MERKIYSGGVITLLVRERGYVTHLAGDGHTFCLCPTPWHRRHRITPSSSSLGPLDARRSADRERPTATSPCRVCTTVGWGSNT